VNDAADRQATVANRTERGANRIRIAHIGRVSADRCAERLEAGDAPASARRIGASTPDQREMTGAVLGKPARSGETKPVKPAGYDIGAITVQRQIRCS
jgi:hypothetical protein